MGGGYGGEVLIKYGGAGIFIFIFEVCSFVGSLSGTRFLLSTSYGDVGTRTVGVR